MAVNHFSHFLSPGFQAQTITKFGKWKILIAFLVLIFFIILFKKKREKYCNIILEPSLSNKWMCIYIVRNCNLEGVFFAKLAIFVFRPALKCSRHPLELRTSWNVIWIATVLGNLVKIDLSTIHPH